MSGIGNRKGQSSLLPFNLFSNCLTFSLQSLAFTRSLPFAVLAIQAKKKRSKPPKAKLKNRSNDQIEHNKKKQASHSRFATFLIIILSFLSLNIRELLPMHLRMAYVLLFE